jgi:hypothetical protein
MKGRNTQGLEGAMVLRVSENLQIDDLRKHSGEQVETLRNLLAAGAPAQPDPHRDDFYEVADGSRVFYIYISPVTGKVVLLAVWPLDGKTASVKRNGRAAA